MKPLKIVCTTTMITDLARNLALDSAEVAGIMKPGEDPHVYDVRPRGAHDRQYIAYVHVPSWVAPGDYGAEPERAFASENQSPSDARLCRSARPEKRDCEEAGVQDARDDYQGCSKLLVSAHPVLSTSSL